jgi:hypothetical protein
MRATDKPFDWLVCLMGARMSREVHVRFCERPVVKSRRPTHPGCQSRSPPAGVRHRGNQNVLHDNFAGFLARSRKRLVASSSDCLPDVRQQLADCIVVAGGCPHTVRVFRGSAYQSRRVRNRRVTHRP